MKNPTLLLRRIIVVRQVMKSVTGALARLKRTHFYENMVTLTLHASGTSSTVVASVYLRHEQLLSSKTFAARIPSIMHPPYTGGKRVLGAM